MPSQHRNISAVPQVIWGALGTIAAAACVGMAVLALEAYAEYDDRFPAFLTFCLVSVLLAALFGFVAVMTASERKKRQAIAVQRRRF